MNLVQTLDLHARNRPDAPAIMLPSGTSLTYRNLAIQTSQFAEYLSRSGLRDGDRLGIHMSNVPEFVIAFLGSLRCGVIPVPLNTRLLPGEVDTLLEFVDARLLITDRADDRVAALSIPTISSTEMRNQIENTETTRDTILKPVARQNLDVASIMFTSGTSSIPKGVVQSHGMHYALGAGFVDFFDISDSDVTAIVNPLFHVGGLTLLNASLVAGCAFVLHSSWDPSRMLESMARNRVTFTHLITTMLLDIVTMEKSVPTGIKLPSLRFVVCGGSASSTAHFAWFEERFECAVTSIYGRTEGGKTWCHPESPRRWTSNGAINRNVCEVRIIGTDSRLPLPDGEQGEIQVRGDGVALGYWRNSDLNEELITAEGWMSTGDLGRISEEGDLYFMGRADGMIKTGGENVFPGEVETVLLGMVGVSEVFVLGVPDPRLGETVAALVVPAGDLSVDDIERYCRQRLPGFKIPRKVKLVSSLPRLGTHKLDVASARAVFFERDAAPKV